MTEQQRSEFFTEIAKIIQAPPGDITESTSLTRYVWDSLAWYSTVAALDDIFGKEVPAGKLADCSTVRDILFLVGE